MLLSACAIVKVVIFLLLDLSGLPLVAMMFFIICRCDQLYYEATGPLDWRARSITGSEHQASGIRHQASSIKHQASSIKNQASSIQSRLPLHDVYR